MEHFASQFGDDGPPMTPDGVRWCCPPFKNGYSIGPHRGVFTVLTTSVDSPLRFALFVQSVDSPGMKGSPLPFAVSLIAELVILHCPWCGQHLDRHYRKQVEALSAIRPVTTLDAFKTSG